MFPSAKLGRLVFAIVERDTRSRSLTNAERFNYYPASPWAMMCWTFEGTVQMVERGAPGQPPKLGAPLPRLSFGGPHRHPAASWCPGPVHGIIVAFYPDALATLIGKRLEPFFDRVVSAEQVLPRPFWDACQSLFDPGPKTDPVRRLEEALTPFWRAARPTTPTVTVNDWVRSKIVQAAFSRTGVGIRQIQRRIKQWTGQNQRDLKRHAQMEQAMGHLVELLGAGKLDITSLALDSGFADQSHMGRVVRRTSGFSPAHFAQMLESDESFWFYRLLEGHLKKVKSN